ncbi:MAG TPA: beta-propeller fold lactonase family protein, partial [Bryobacteraceae bacterium]|nr:beta-propeller fold lactonase family protein [Bryobacteraceae bacterium]
MGIRWFVLVTAAVLAVVAACLWPHKPAVAATLNGGPYSNQPIALSRDDSTLAVANPDLNTVTIFQVAGDKNTKVAEVPVGKEPAGVAWSADGTTLYVANQADGTVALVSQYNGSYQVTSTITVGTEPHGMVMSASGKKLYVTNTRSNNVSVIDTTLNYVNSVISNVGPEPRGIAITHGANVTDNNQVVYVTDFLALPAGNGKPDGFDDAKTGFVTAISVANDAVIGSIQLGTVADTGFKAAGDALQHIAAPANPATTDFTFTTGAYPNQLNNLATHGNFAYLPNTGASPNGPVRSNVNTQSLLSV